MFSGPPVFTQVMDFLPQKTFQRCVERYQGNFSVKRFTCRDQFRTMAFAQLTYRESLRDIEACLRSQGSKLYHMGIRSNVSRSTLAEANEVRNWRIYADLAYRLIGIARDLYREEPLAVELQEPVYALDATTIDLCLSLFPWAHFRRDKGAVKLHTLLDLRGNIPTFIHISDGKCHEVNALDVIPVEPGSFYVMDRGFVDYARLSHLSQELAFFVIRARSNLQFRRLYSQPTDRSAGLICDQIIKLSLRHSARAYPDKIRRVKYRDAETDQTLVFLTNNFTLPALKIPQLYKQRWQIELFFMWIKQNLRIKAFYGTSENAVKTQIWIAVTVYLLVAIIKKRLCIEASLYTMLQILSVTIFERTPLYQLLTFCGSGNQMPDIDNQLNLFTDYSGH